MKRKTLMTSSTTALSSIPVFVASFTLMLAIWGGPLAGSGLPPQSAGGSAPATNAEERIWLQAEVNGKPVKMALDTGAEATALFRETATRLGLHVTNPPPGTAIGPGQVPMGQTEICDFKVLGTTLQTQLGVVDLPTRMRTQTEGVVGWPNLGGDVFEFNAASTELSGPRTVPDKVRDWLKLGLVTNASALILEIPGPKTNVGSLLIDTGNQDGLALAPGLWREWTNSHPQRARTLIAYAGLGTGISVHEVAWADEIALGPLVLTQAPVHEADPHELVLASENFAALLGLAALKRLDLVVDRSNGVAYAHLATIPAWPYRHNRIGAVFTPADLQRGQDLIACVLPGTPAYEAGVREGDILQKIDNLDVTEWRTNPAVMPLGRFFEQPAGTKITLKLKRGTEAVQAVVTLRDLLGPKEPERR
jgi:hypothetical protein